MKIIAAFLFSFCMLSGFSASIVFATAKPDCNNALEQLSKLRLASLSAGSRAERLFLEKDYSTKIEELSQKMGITRKELEKLLSNKTVIEKKAISKTENKDIRVEEKLHKLEKLTELLSENPSFAESEVIANSFLKHLEKGVTLDFIINGLVKKMTITTKADFNKVLTIPILILISKIRSSSSNLELINKIESFRFSEHPIMCESLRIASGQHNNINLDLEGKADANLTTALIFYEKNQNWINDSSAFSQIIHDYQDKQLLDFFKTLTTYGFQPEEYVDDSGDTLFTLLDGTHIDVLKFLVEEHHLDFHAVLSDGDPIVFHADNIVLEYYLSKGLVPDLVNSHGNTLLHECFSRGADFFEPKHLLRRMKTLLDAGADPTWENNQGLTPLELAIKSENLKAIKLLKKYIPK